MGGVCPKTKLWNNLKERDYMTLKEFYVRAEKYLRVENVEEAQGKANSPTKNSKDKKRKHKEPKPNEQKRQRPEDRAPQVLLSRYTYYTELNTDRAEVFWVNEGLVHFRMPFPIRKERTKRE